MNKQQTQNHKVYFNDFGFAVYFQSGALREREANPIRKMSTGNNIGWD